MLFHVGALNKLQSAREPATIVWVLFVARGEPERAVLEGLLKIGGVTALTIGVFFLLYRQLLSLKIFTRLGAGQTLIIICLLAILVWSIAMAALVLTDQGMKVMIFGHRNIVNQGVSSP